MKSFTFRTTVAALCLCLCCFGTAVVAQQKSVLYSKPVSPLLKELPALPTSAAAAYKMVKVVGLEQDQQKVATTESYTALKAKSQRIMDELQASTVVLSANAGSTSSEQEALIEQMQDPEFQKKLETMSEADKMAFAMKAQQIMAQSTMQNNTLNGVEDEEVIAVLESMGDISMELNGSYGEPSSYTKLSQKIGEIRQKVSEHNKQVWEWEQKEYEKVPLVPSHLRQQVVSNKEPKLVKELRLKAQAKRIAFLDQQLKALAPAWNAHLSSLQQTLATVDEQMAGIDYYDRFKNNAFKNQLVGYNLAPLQQIQYLWVELENIVLESAEMQLALSRLENKPVELFD
jgi:hypothetical protein